MPRSTVVAGERRSIWASLSLAPARLMLSPSTSPSQPSRSASAMRLMRLSRISMIRGRWAGSGLVHRTSQAFSWMHGVELARGSTTGARGARWPAPGSSGGRAPRDVRPARHLAGYQAGRPRPVSTRQAGSPRPAARDQPCGPPPASAIARSGPARAGLDSAIRFCRLRRDHQLAPGPRGRPGPARDHRVRAGRAIPTDRCCG